MKLTKLTIIAAICGLVLLPLWGNKVFACATTNPANVSCNPTYYHQGADLKVVVKETSEVKLWLPNKEFPVVVVISEPGVADTTVWWEDKPTTPAAWDTRTVVVPAGSSKTITYKMQMCEADHTGCVDLYGWMPSNIGTQRYNCGTGCSCITEDKEHDYYYGQYKLQSFVTTVTNQLNGAKFYDLQTTGYSLFSPNQRVAGTADKALTCWNDNIGTKSNQADFNDFGALWTVKAVAAATAPVVTTSSPVTNVLETTATAGGNVTSDGGSAILERGVVFSHSNATPTTADTKVIVTGTTGVFTANLTGLSPYTKYYVRAYAKNAIGTAYGAVVSFTTKEAIQGPPSVTTSEVTSISGTTAVGGGNVTSAGSGAVTARGIVFSKTNLTPTIADTKVAVTGTTGEYTANMSGLTANTKYYVRAYATNAIGTSYGAVIEFTTATGNLSAPTVVTVSPAKNVDATGATISGNVTADGGSTITERGIVYSASKTIPTLSDSINRNDPGKLGTFSIDLTGLSPRTHYYARAYAKNAIGTSYGAVVEFTTDLSVPTHTPTDTGFSDDFLMYFGGTLYVMGIGMFIGARAVSKKTSRSTLSV